MSITDIYVDDVMHFIFSHKYNNNLVEDLSDIN